MTDLTNAPTLPEEPHTVKTLRKWRDEGMNVHADHSILNHIDALRDQLSAETARADACEKDARRLDWLEDETKCYWVEVQAQPSGNVVYAGSGKALREAMDSAWGAPT